MLTLILVKLGRSLLTLLICVTFVFVVLRVSGDPATQLLPDDTPLEVLEEYRARWGLDRPIWEQYVRYLGSVARGDFGISFADDRDALGVVVERIPATLQLGSLAFALSLLIGVPLGMLAALKRNTWVDRLAMGFAVLGYSLPNFFLAILLILCFSLWLRVLPSAGSQTSWHMVMPVVTLGTAAAGTIARFVRTAMLEVMGQPYLRTARGKGMGRGRQLVAHAVPNAAIPVVTVIGFQLGGLIGGAVITETVFAWPGVGRLLVTAVGQRDLAVVQAIVLMVAATMVVANLVVDLAYGWLDPRVRAIGAKGGAS